MINFDVFGDLPVLDEMVLFPLPPMELGISTSAKRALSTDTDEFEPEVKKKKEIDRKEKNRLAAAASRRRQKKKLKKAEEVSCQAEALAKLVIQSSDQESTVFKEAFHLLSLLEKKI